MTAPGVPPCRSWAKVRYKGLLDELFGKPHLGRQYLYFRYKVQAKPNSRAAINWPEIEAIWRNVERTLEEMHLCFDRDFHTTDEVEAHRRELRRSFTPPRPNRKEELSPDMLFSDYMLYWLKIIRPAVQETTWSSYNFNVKNHIVPYFEPTGITLGGLQARHIQSFYLHELETLKATSVLRQHANLHKALKYAVKLDLIPGNPVDKVERPKPEKYLAAYYTAEEMEQLFEAARGHRLELIIQFAAFYGLRRGEVLGLRWDAVDFEAGTLTIRHIVTSTNLEGKHVLVEADRAKTKSSLRTLPLVASFAQRLRALKEQQAYNEKLCGNCYNQKYKGYLFVDEMGNLILPNAVTDGFAKLLIDHGLRKIRFHDLRHSCASLLLKQGVPMKQIQEWLGHSDISTTANIYAHLDSQSKQLSAATMEQALPLPESRMTNRWQT